MTPEIVIAMYRPREGKRDAFLQLLAEHHPALVRLELVTDREPVMFEAGDGTILELFEWRDHDSARLAHEHPEVARIWEGMGPLAELVTLGSLEEASKQFPHFRPLALAPRA